MIKDIREVCNKFQKKLDNLERKCSVCRSIVWGNMLEVDYSPLTGELGLICRSCSRIQNKMIEEITGPITMNDFFLRPTVGMQTYMRIEEARKEVRIKMLGETQ